MSEGTDDEFDPDIAFDFQKLYLGRKTEQVEAAVRELEKVRWVGDDDDETPIEFTLNEEDDNEDDENDPVIRTGIRKIFIQADPDEQNESELAYIGAMYKDTVYTLFVGLPNARLGQDFQPPSGFALGVSRTVKNVPLHLELLPTEKMFYGLTAVRLPVPKGEEDPTYDVYKKTRQEIKEVLESVREQMKFDFDGSFVGIYEQVEDIDLMFQRRLWIVVQDGDIETSLGFYNAVENSEISSFHQALDPLALKMKETVSAKRMGQIRCVLDALGLRYDGLNFDETDTVDQPAFSFAQTTDKLYTVFYSGCFPVVDCHHVLIGDTPRRGFTVLNGEPPSQSWSCIKDVMRAFPYGTGHLPNVSKKSPGTVPWYLFGNDDRVMSLKFRQHNTAFRQAEEHLGRNPALPYSVLKPYVVMFNMAEKHPYEDSIWK